VKPDKRLKPYVVSDFPKRTKQVNQEKLYREPAKKELAPEEAGPLQQFVEGTYRCKAYAEGGQEKPHPMCYVFFSILVVGVVFQIGSCLLSTVSFLSRPSTRRFGNWCLGVVLLALNYLVAYMMYRHCQNCNGALGFGKVLLVNLFSWTLMIVSVLLATSSVPSQQTPQALPAIQAWRTPS
jgi:hypothetical protein